MSQQRHEAFCFLWSSLLPVANLAKRLGEVAVRSTIQGFRPTLMIRSRSTAASLRDLGIHMPVIASAVTSRTQPTRRRQLRKNSPMIQVPWAGMGSQTFFPNAGLGLVSSRNAESNVNGTVMDQYGTTQSSTRFFRVLALFILAPK
jgi:hypothetical protein